MRVCPSIKSRKGWVWTKNAYNKTNWMIDVATRVTGRLKHGADGMVGGGRVIVLVENRC